MVDGYSVVLEAANPAVDGPEAAQKSILHMAATKLISNKNTGNEDYLFRDYIAVTWSLIDYMLAKNLEHNGEPGFTIHSRQCKIQGYEFLSLVYPESVLTKKEIAIKHDYGGWLTLLKGTGALVHFADGFGEIIKSFGFLGRLLCSKYKTLP